MAQQSIHCKKSLNYLLNILIRAAPPSVTTGSHSAVAAFEYFASGNLNSPMTCTRGGTVVDRVAKYFHFEMSVRVRRSFFYYCASVTTNFYIYFD